MAERSSRTIIRTGKRSGGSRDSVARGSVTQGLGTQTLVMSGAGGAGKGKVRKGTATESAIRKSPTGRKSPIKKSPIKMSSLGYALLSLLARRERSGYELSSFSSPPQSLTLWSAGHSQIYPELAKLAKAGYVTFSTVQVTNRPDKKIYQVTEAGLDRLRHWAVEPPKRSPQRQDLNIKTHAAWLADPAAMCALFRAQAEQAEDDLLRIKEHWSKIQAINGTTGTPKVSERLFGTYANVRLALANTKERADWCRWLEKQFAALAGGPPRRGRKERAPLPKPRPRSR